MNIDARETKRAGRMRLKLERISHKISSRVLRESKLIYINVLHVKLAAAAGHIANHASHSINQESSRGPLLQLRGQIPTPDYQIADCFSS